MVANKFTWTVRNMISIIRRFRYVISFVYVPYFTPNSHVAVRRTRTLPMWAKVGQLVTDVLNILKSPRNPLKVFKTLSRSRTGS